MNNHWKSSIIFTSGIFGKKPTKGYCVVASAVGALNAATRALSLELATYPRERGKPRYHSYGNVRSSGSEALDKMIAAMETRSLLEKLGQPEEVGEAYIYLMRDTNTTGAIVDTNGGAFLQ